MPFGAVEDGGSWCCSEVERSLSVVDGAAEGAEEPGRFGELDGVAVEEVALLRTEESFQPEVAAVAEWVTDG